MLAVRIATALVALGLFLPAILWAPDWLWTLLCAALSAWAAWEWARLAGLPGLGSVLAAMVLAAIDAGLWHAPAARPAAYAVAVLFWVVAAPWLLASGPRGRPGPPTPAKLAMGLVVLPAVFAALVAIREQGPGVLLVSMGVVWISDSAAYFTGRALGRRKLAPTVSPGKTWEGAAGALIAVAVYTLAVHWLFPALAVPLLWLLPLFLVLAVAGIVGDLLESLLKRWAGVKDSGSALPGHGGILDRVDALLPVLPLAALAFQVMNHAALNPTPLTP
jgi:phosphatidate cytidylyltransferase